MNKPELIDSMTMKKGNLPRKIVEISADTILELLADTLTKGGRIEIRGFGSFETRIYKARISRNPKTGEPVQLLERPGVHFKPGKQMKDNVNASR